MSYGPLAAPLSLPVGWSNPALRRASPPLRRPLWWVLLAGALCTDVALPAFGNAILGPGLFLILWGIAAIAASRTTLDAATAARLPWIFPALGLASVLWSDHPLLSLKMAGYLAATIVAAQLMARRLALRDVILACLLVTLTGGVASLLLGHQRDGLVGIYGSKNSLAFYAGLLLLTGLAALLDDRQPRLARWLGLVGCGVAPVLLVAGQSVGALLASLAAAGVLILVAAARWLPAGARPGYVLLCGALGLCGGGLVFGLVLLEADGLLALLGKQDHLTGRTYLWQRAAELIAQRPLFGLGLNAFWVQDSIEAEGLWRFAHIGSRGGFHFHNLYYAVLVELGLVGLLALAATLLLTGVAVLRWCFRRPDAESGFALAFLLYLGLRSVVEVEVGIPFSLHAMLFYALWSYARRPAPPMRGWPLMVRPQGASP